MIEYFIVLGAIAFVVYMLKKKKAPSKPLVVKGVVYDSETNTIKLTLHNKNPICYKYKSSIRYKETAPAPAPGMMTASSDGRPLSMLLAETPSAQTIGPNETIQVTLNPALPDDMISSGAFGPLSVELKFVKYEDVLLSGTEWQPEVITPPQVIQQPEIVQTQPTPNEIIIDAAPTIEKPKQATPAPIPAFIHVANKRPGHNFGHSQTMLEIIRMMDRLKSHRPPTIKDDGVTPFSDAI